MRERQLTPTIVTRLTEVTLNPQNPPLTHWVQLLLVPPPQIQLQLFCTVDGPTSSINYTLIVLDPEGDGEVAVQTTDQFDTTVLPQRVLDMLRDQLTAARLVVSPF